jgi:molybdenum cofactor biosynthesis enzyme MoaA
MIQIDGPKRNLYIKFKSVDKQRQILQDTKGQREYKHENGEISIVTIEPAGMGIRTIRIANLTPEVNDQTILNILTKYGEVTELKEEQWSRNYRYKIYDGIRIATMNLREHIPSYVTIANNRVLVSYDGQPLTCYGCNHTGHQFQECPTRRQSQTRLTKPAPTTWTEIVKHGNTTTPTAEGNIRSIQRQGHPNQG